MSVLKLTEAAVAVTTWLDPLTLRRMVPPATICRVHFWTFKVVDQFMALGGKNQNEKSLRKMRPPNALVMCSRTSKHELKFLL